VIAPGSAGSPNKQAALELVRDPREVSAQVADALRQVERIVAGLVHDRRMGRHLSLDAVAKLIGHATTLLILAPSEYR
jgi:hypothetical protein